MSTETSSHIGSRLYNAEHFMFDFETLGLEPTVHPIIEIGIVRFSLRHEDAGKNKEKWHCPVKASTNRKIDMQTIAWHADDPERTKHFVYLMKEAIAPIVAFSGAVAWIQNQVAGSGKEIYFWSKPAQFDWSFWCSHLEEFNLTNPFGRRNVIDVRSFISGLAIFHPEVSKFTEDSFKVGSHKAIEDADCQVNLVLRALGYLC